MKSVTALGLCVLLACGDNADQKPDAGAVTYDAATDGGAESGTGDAQLLGDVSVPVTRVACGSSFCRADQQCDAGVCTQSCTGAKVPGDYATLQAALTALATAPGDSTICLQQGHVFTESPSATGSDANKTLTIMGPSSARVDGLSLEGTFAKVVLRGFSTGNAWIVTKGAVDAIAMTMDVISIQGAPTKVMIDGCNVGSPSQYEAIDISPMSDSLQSDITIQNSWIHDAKNWGVVLMEQSSALVTVHILDNTFQRNGTGIREPSNLPIAITYSNNIIAGSLQAGVDIATSNVTHSNNLMWGNAANYANLAVEGPGYVKADPMFDAETPPGLENNSPARGAGDPTIQPATDYWGVPRTSADIGAVQGL